MKLPNNFVKKRRRQKGEIKYSKVYQKAFQRRLRKILSKVASKA